MNTPDLSIEAKKARRKVLVAALRSGEYVQAKGALCQIDFKTKKEGYCCLGVASVLVRPADGEATICCSSRKYWRDVAYQNISNELNMTTDIRDAYGFTAQSGSFKYTSAIIEKFPRLADAAKLPYHFFVDESRIHLTTLNDTLNWSFKEIADLIEFEPEGMFTD